MVHQLAPWPTWCECVNPNLSFFMYEMLMFGLLRRLLKKQCMHTVDPQKMPGALCACLSMAFPYPHLSELRAIWVQPGNFHPPFHPHGPHLFHFSGQRKQPCPRGLQAPSAKWNWASKAVSLHTASLPSLLPSPLKPNSLCTFPLRLN